MPYCADWRHPSDTLFLIAEEDWRLHADHDKKGELTSEDFATKRVRELSSPATVTQLNTDRASVVYPRFASIVEPPAEPGQDAEPDGQDSWLEAGLGFYTQGKKPSADSFNETTQELQDIVKICCEADRAGASDLLWMSWMEASCRRKRAPSRFSGLIAVSALGARKLLDNFEKWIPMGCLDVNLRKAVDGNADCRAKLAAGFLYPSLGHYSEHFAEAVAGIREGYWNSKYICQSTRGPSEPPAAPWDGNFFIYGFIDKGDNPLMHEGFSLPEQQGEDLTWWTAAITVPEPPAGRVQVHRMHRRRHQNKPTLHWRPKGLHTPIRPEPQQIDNSEDRYGPINVSSYQIVDEDEDTFSKDTTSFQRRFRAAVSLFLRRNFTNNPAKVGIFDLCFQPTHLFNSNCFLVVIGFGFYSSSGKTFTTTL